MASNVIVLHNNRRYAIKTTPSMLCREILVQACEKIGFHNVENYGLKNGKNTVDLALPVRLANLAPGAKLEIYKINALEASKPITLALQCSDPPIRLTGTFPPTATLTEVLLHFEQESNGRLVIFGRRGQEAVLSVLGREFSISEGSGGGGGTTLAGMGVGGNVLIRLGFRKSGSATVNTSTTSSSVPSSHQSQPSVQTESPKVSTSSSPQVSPPPQQILPPPVSSHSLAPNESSTVQHQHVFEQIPSPPVAALDPPAPLATASTQAAGPVNRNRIVYTAATASTPTAAKLDVDDAAYNMTTEQAKNYQAYLTSNAKSFSEKTLMTREMREIAEREKASKRAFTQCDVRIRFPDGTQVQGSFAADETVGDIYQFVKEQLANQEIPFQLHLLPRGNLADLTQTIRDSGFSTRTLLMFVWSHPVQGRALKADLLQDAVDIEGIARELLGDEVQPKGKAKESSEGTSSKLPKWFTKLSKK